MNGTNLRQSAPVSTLPKRKQLIKDINHYLGYTKKMLSAKKDRELRTLWSRIDVPEIQDRITQGEYAVDLSFLSTQVSEQKDWAQWVQDHTPQRPIAWPPR